MRSMTNLRVFHRAHDLAVRIATVTSEILPRPHPGLASQLRRAAASVPANIAEGCGHSSRYEFARFLQLALASNVETEYHLQFARDVNAISVAQHSELSAESNAVRRMLASLLRKVRDELSEAGVDGEATTRAEPTRNPIGYKPDSKGLNRGERNSNQLISNETSSQQRARNLSTNEQPSTSKRRVRVRATLANFYC